MLYPGWRSFFSSLFCHALFQSRNFCGTFFISAIDFCLQDSLDHKDGQDTHKQQDSDQHISYDPYICHFGCWDKV